MDPIVAVVERMLREAPAPAVRMSSLADRLREGGHRLPGGAPALRSHLERHPERFRVLEVWRTLAPGEAWPAADAWVALVVFPGTPPGPGGAARLLHDSVRWLARAVDRRSRSEVARWQAMAERSDQARRFLRSA